jgi:lipopolysaccharide biosynthesis regulator YciM
MPLELLWFLLLPAAAASGWWAASSRSQSGERRLSREYFEGVNFLLNEQPDKALEIFVNMIEIDSETVEPHFALGSLFRRQGEVERAIRIHQSLMARTTLSREHRKQALFELGQDYLQAGLLDRAENLFRELLERDPRHAGARRLLIQIYEQEKEWERAISVASLLDDDAGHSFKSIIANYYCELAVQAFEARNFPRVKRMIRRAMCHDRHCARASLLEGEVERARGRYRAAVRAFKRVSKQDPAYFSEAIDPLLDCCERLGRGYEAIEYLKTVLARQDAFGPVLRLSKYMEQRGHEQEARDFISAYLRSHPSLPGLAYLIEALPLDGTTRRGESLDVARGSLRSLLGAVHSYHCARCGYGGSVLRWQCPGCRSWNSIKPHQGRAA